MLERRRRVRTHHVVQPDRTTRVSEVGRCVHKAGREMKLLAHDACELCVIVGDTACRHVDRCVVSVIDETAVTHSAVSVELPHYQSTFETAKAALGDAHIKYGC